mgnify:CR=1 FL=1
MNMFLNQIIGRYSLGKSSGARGRDRTTDTAIFSRMLYQLSYLGDAGAPDACGLIESRAAIGKSNSASTRDRSISIGRGRSRIAVFVLVRDRRDRVTPGQPAIEIDIGAAFRAERTIALDRRFAANRAGANGLWGVGHGDGRQARLAQLRRAGKPSPSNRDCVS